MAATLTRALSRPGTRAARPEKEPRAPRTPRTPRTPRVPRAPRPPRPEGTTGATLVATTMLLVFGLILGFAAYLFVGSALASDRHQDVMYDDLKEQLAQATVPVAGVIPTGTPVGLVEVPALGLEQVFVIGSASEQTVNGPGLRHDSQLPGQAGISVLVGRRAGFGAPFGNIDELRIGDRIVVTTGQGRFTYVVDIVRTSDEAVDIAPATSRLTLVTSDPPVAPNRTLQVSAVLDGDALPAATGVPSVADDAPGAGSTGRSVALLLWAQLLLVLVSWAALRLPPRARRGIWIGGAPLLLAILWNVFENLAVLLPNTL